MTTVKMPRSHNRQKFLITYGDILHRTGLRIAYISFWVILIWAMIYAAYAFYVWTDNLILENHMLKMELREEKAAYKAAFVEPALKKKREDEERAKAVKKWQHENPKLAGIFNAR